MFKMTFVTGLLGMGLMLAFLGFLLVWIQSVPLTIIMVGVIGLMIWDFVNTIRETNGSAK